MRSTQLFILLSTSVLLCCTNLEKEKTKIVKEKAQQYITVLGIAQDAGFPQINCEKQCCKSFYNGEEDEKLVSCLGLVDLHEDKKWVFDATPDVTAQLETLKVDHLDNNHIVNGVFLTHAHIGHYTGLMFAGHESIGTQGLNVFPLPRMQNYLENNGPWDQLVNYKNIDLISMMPKKPVVFNDDLSVTAYLVPHRDEYSETAGYVVKGPSKSVLFLPDIDDWDRWETEFNTRIEDMISQVDVAYLDATFFDNNELPGRDMSKIPHPRVADSMTRFKNLPLTEQKKVRFFHINHSNKIRYSSSEQYSSVQQKGFKIAKRGERVCLD